MENLKIFENSEFGKVRMVMIDGKPYFAGVDVARALEYADTKNTIKDHCDGGVSYPLIDSLGRTQESIVIPKGDVYRLIVGASRQSKNLEIKEKAKRFESWIFDEVLPDIDNHGMYMTYETIDRFVSDPNSFIKIMELYRDEKDKRIELEKHLEYVKPKIDFANAVEDSDGLLLVRDIAKILKQNGIDIGGNRLLEEMRKDGFLINEKYNDRNRPTQKSMNAGLFKFTEWYGEDGKVIITPKVTGKGQTYFIDYYTKKLKVNKIVFPRLTITA